MRLNNATKDRSFFSNTNFMNFINKSKILGGFIHLFGLFSCGGVHSHEDHFYEVINFLLLHTDFNIKLHLVLDGRDSGVNDGYNSLKKILNVYIKDSNNRLQIASIIGRSFAMDRDNRYEKTKIAYDSIVHGSSKSFELFDNESRILPLLSKMYVEFQSDEYIPPLINKFYGGFNFEKDSIFFLNWRADRMRQIVSSFILPEFNEFERAGLILKNSLCMSEYSNKFKDFSESVFFKEDIKNTLGDCFEQNNLKQLRISETEKYAHVTFFFDGGNNVFHKNKHEILVPSPKDVKTYDQKPEMSGFELTNNIISNLDNFDVIIANFPNLDMVGHTGNFESTVKACEFISLFVEKIDYEISNKVNKEDYILIITSDHGNAEEMLNFDGSIKTSHTLNNVPFYIKNYTNNYNFKLKKDLCELADIAPTILSLIGIKIPNEMLGRELVLFNQSLS